MISFGVEFEFDYITPSNERRVFSGIYPRVITSGWDWQPDQTASSELRSPVFTSLFDYVHSVNRQFNEFINHDPSLIPYPFNGDSRSLGQHIHIGKPNQHLSDRTRHKIAEKAIRFYPFLAAIHAQPIPSQRGLTTIWAKSMVFYGDVIDRDHYAEISKNLNGTVEFRLFDCNIPQASLVCAWILTEIAKNTLRHRRDPNDGPVDLRAYDMERGRALRYGLISLDVTSYLKRLKELIGAVEIPNIPSLREALYLLARYRLNFYGVYRYCNAKPYEYCKAQYGDCSRFLENLLTIPNIQHAEKIRSWVNEASQIENLDQLIGLSIGVDRSLAEAMGLAEQEQAAAQPAPQPRVESVFTRSQIRGLIERGSYVISRIHEVNGLSTAEVAERISYLLNHHGDGMVTDMSAEGIIESPFRFYVFTVMDRDSNQLQICGAVSIHVREGQIRSLVVDRRFRRLGIARLLLNHVIRVANEHNLESVYAYIRNDNEASLALFRSLGFMERDRVERAVVMVKPLRGV